jgi:hypothetical protein
MLQHFTWQQFLTAALIFTLIWYLVIFLAVYRREVFDFLRGKQKPKTSPEPLGHEWDTEFEETPLAEESLMGRSALPEGVSRVSMDQFSFAPQVEKEQTYPFPDEELLGVIPDVLEEIKTAIHTIVTIEGSKADFIDLFKVIAAKYPKLKESRHLAAIDEWISENVPFTFSERELQQRWQ